LVRAAKSDADAAIFLTAAFTGLRRGELLGLRWRDVDFTGSRIRVRASYAAGKLTAPKSGKVRAVPWRYRHRQELGRGHDHRHRQGARAVASDDRELTRGRRRWPPDSYRPDSCLPATRERHHHRQLAQCPAINGTVIGALR
jgi:integrase